jgi:hypothetical protein
LQNACLFSLHLCKLVLLLAQFCSPLPICIRNTLCFAPTLRFYRNLVLTLPGLQRFLCQLFQLETVAHELGCRSSLPTPLAVETNRSLPRCTENTPRGHGHCFKQIMAALVQTYPQQSSTATMLQTRPSSTGSMMATGQSRGNHPYDIGGPQAPRAAYGSNGAAAYRSGSGSAQSFAFSSTPNLSQTLSWQQYGAYRTNSSPAAPSAQNFDGGIAYRPAMQSSSSVNAMGYPNSFGVGYGGSRDDSALSPSRATAPTARPQSYLSVSTQPSFSASTKQNGPDRYRRTTSVQTSHHGRSQSTALPTNPSMAPPSQVFQANRRYSVSNMSGHQGLASVSSADDLQQYRKANQEEAMRMRRRSVHTIENREFTNTRPISRDSADGKQVRLTQTNSHSRNGSSESVTSNRSSHSRPSSVSYDYVHPHLPNRLD